MIDLGPHAAFIWISYAAAVIAIAGLLIWVFADERGQQRRLADLERRGIRRRSSAAREAAKGTGS
jgi:heme exporter protein D